MAKNLFFLGIVKRFKKILRLFFDVFYRVNRISDICSSYCLNILHWLRTVQFEDCEFLKEHNVKINLN